MAKAGNPRPLTDAEVGEVLRLVRVRHELDFSLQGTLSGGEGPGAYALQSSDGPSVLKFLNGAQPDDLAPVASAVDALRDRGYPVPPYLCWGAFANGTYVIQGRLDGSPIGDAFGERHVTAVLGLNRLQADATPARSTRWPDPVVKPMLEGGRGYCLLETMKTHTAESRALLGEVQNIARDDGPSVEPRSDFVHFDFSQANILADGDRSPGSSTGMRYVWATEHST